MIRDKNVPESFSAYMAIGSELREAGYTQSHSETQHYIDGWIETRDPRYLDELIIFCDENEMPVTKTLRLYMASAARHRLPTKRNSRAKNKMLKRFAFFTMAQRIYLRNTMPQAAGHAAVVYRIMAKGRHQLLASTLERQYPSEFIETGGEERWISIWDMYVDKEDHHWGELLIPDDELKGNRR